MYMCGVLAIWVPVQKQTFVSTYVLSEAPALLEVINHAFFPTYTQQQWEDKMSGNRLPLSFLLQSAILFNVALTFKHVDWRIASWDISQAVCDVLLKYHSNAYTLHRNISSLWIGGRKCGWSERDRVSIESWRRHSDIHARIPRLLPDFFLTI